MAQNYKQSTFYPVATDLNGDFVLDVLDYQWVKFINALKSRKALPHRVKQHEVANLPKLAHDYYDDEGLWWIIGQYNDIIDPLGGITQGMILFIPSFQDISTVYRSTQGVRRNRSSRVRFPRNAV